MTAVHISSPDGGGIGLIGFGGIARTVIGLQRREGHEPVTGILVREGRGDAVAAEGLRAVTTADALVALQPSLVVECAGQEAVEVHGPTVLDAGIDLLVVSIGALAEPRVEDRLMSAARRGAARLLLPAGAIGGIDALAAMRLGGLDRVTYRSRKPPSAWGEPEGVYRTLFSGPAREAARRWPRNANVAATVALAGLGLDWTHVELLADPEAPGNVHEIEAEGASGRLHIRLEGRPSPENPRTSALTALSVARALLNRSALIQI